MFPVNKSQVVQIRSSTICHDRCKTSKKEDHLLVFRDEYLQFQQLCHSALPSQIQKYRYSALPSHMKKYRIVIIHYRHTYRSTVTVHYRSQYCTFEVKMDFFQQYRLVARLRDGFFQQYRHSALLSYYTFEVKIDGFLCQGNMTKNPPRSKRAQYDVPLWVQSQLTSFH